jgi:uncharacterized protein (TIGR02145 family)
MKDEFDALISCLGASNPSGKYYPESSTWGGPRAGDTGEGSMNNVGSSGLYWTAEATNSNNAYYMAYSSTNTYTAITSKHYGFPVRCVK